MKTMELSGTKDIAITSDSSIVIADKSNVRIIIRPSGDCTLELKIGKKCNVSCFTCQAFPCAVIQNSTLDADSVLHSSGFWLGGSADVSSSLIGKNSRAYSVHMFVGKGTNIFHLDAVLKHAAKNTKGDILAKGVVRDSATAKLDGMIKIEKTGAGADSFLTEQVILLNPGAHATANPELEIDNNDVTSRHSASVSQIDEEKIFYMMSRGLTREESKGLIVQGFLESAAQKIEDKLMRKEAMKAILAQI